MAGIDFDLLARLSDREVQILMREIDQKDLVVSLASASEEVKERLLNNVSARVRAFILWEMEFLGAVPPEETEETQQRVLGATAALAVAGWIDWPKGVRARAGEATPAPVCRPDPGLASLCARSLDQLTAEEIEQMWKGLRQTEARHRMVVVGIEAIQMGREPEEIAELVKQAAA